MLRNHNIIIIIFSLIDFKRRLSRRDTDERFHFSTTQDKVKNLIDFKRRLSRRDTDERFHFSTTQDKVKNSTKSSMRYVGTARYGHIDSFGKF
jgi:hypothetical protein